jgi:hypothetical protein
MCFPWALARLLPSAVRVRIRSRSTSAKPPRTASNKRPVLGSVSAHGSAKDRNCDRRELNRMLGKLAPGDVVTVTRIDRLAPAEKVCGMALTSTPRSQMYLRADVRTAQGMKRPSPFLCSGLTLSLLRFRLPLSRQSLCLGDLGWCHLSGKRIAGHRGDSGYR